MSIRLMHLADLHLGAPMSYLGPKAEERSKDLESAFFRALELTHEKHVHAVLIAGDLFDSFNPPLELAQRVKAALAKTAAQGIPIILIPGTHDNNRYARCVYKREEFPGADIIPDFLKTVEKELNGHPVRFYGFSGGGSRNQQAPPFHRGDGKGFHIALVHGTVSDGIHWTPSTRDFSLTPADLNASGFNYVALGHHHSFQELRHGQVTAVYPGTLEGLKFGENGERCLVIAEISDNNVSLELVRHNRRTVTEITMDLSTPEIESDGDLTAAVAKYADKDAIVRVSLSGAAGFIPEARRIEAELSGRFFHLEIADATRLYDSQMVRSAANESTIRGIFIRKMLEKIQQCSDEERPAAELALRLGIQQFMEIHNTR